MRIARTSLLTLTLIISTALSREAQCQAGPEIGLIQQGLDLGIRITGSCTSDEATAVLRAWLFLAGELRNDPTLSQAFSRCIDSASLVEIGCADQFDRGRMKRALLSDDYNWEVECVDFPPITDSLGRPARTHADAVIGVSGANMRIDRSFIRGSGTMDIAGVMAHELEHNRGFSHKHHEFGQQFYELTVPQQIRACIESLPSGATPNPPPKDFWDWKECCSAGNRWCDSRNCYITSELQCEWAPSGYNECGYTLFHPDGTPVQPSENLYPDPGFCAWNQVAGPLPPGGTATP